MVVAELPDCPHLPPDPGGLDWRHLHQFRTGARAGTYYRACLEYAQSLWRRRLAARALLCLDRALGADLRGDEPELRDWPLPYAALAWVLAHTPREVFLGNPRVHFQHYAGRMNPPRREQRVWRAWACWALARAQRPEDPGDPRQVITEPTLDAIAAGLDRHGLAGESLLWREALPAGPR